MIGYSERDKKYYEFSHLSKGIYNGYILTGFVINERAVDYQKSFAEIIDEQPYYFLGYFKKLDQERRVIWYDDVELFGSPRKRDLRNLSKKIKEDYGWFV